MIDLLPDDLVWEEGPLAILSAQAPLLKGKTENIVIAKVIEAETPYGFYRPPRYDFFLIAIPLEYFHHRLFTVKCHQESYPVAFFLDEKFEKELKSKLGEWKRRLTALKEEEFVLILETIFRSERTQELIGSLMKLSDEFTPDHASASGRRGEAAR